MPYAIRLYTVYQNSCQCKQNAAKISCSLFQPPRTSQPGFKQMYRRLNATSGHI